MDLETCLYEAKPYGVIAFGGLNVTDLPWWGATSGITLILLGLLILAMRYQYRTTP